MGAARLEFRLDMFNAFNTTSSTIGRHEIQYVSPTDLTIRESAVPRGTAGGQTRTPEPKDAGFGAATGAQNMRNLQLQIRFQF